MSCDYKELLSTNQLETGANPSFSECELVFPAVKAAKSESVNPHLFPSGSLEP